MTALDPAGPLFTPFSTDALSKNDFQFVDSIHTSAGLAGEFEIRYGKKTSRVVVNVLVFHRQTEYFFLSETFINF